MMQTLQPDPERFRELAHYRMPFGKHKGLLLIDLLQLLRIHPLLGISLLLAIGNFLIVFGPPTYRLMRQRGEVAVRRRKFEASKMPESESLHRCASCGKTEHDDADLEFRVAGDGEEYCKEHLPGNPPD